MPAWPGRSTAKEMIVKMRWKYAWDYGKLSGKELHRLCSYSSFSILLLEEDVGMVREMTFIKHNGNKDEMKIRGRMYLPEAAQGKLPVVVFCHGFGGNYRELMHHGEGYAEAGICCLFFDFCGGGRLSWSDGAMEEMTVRSECEDLKTVLSSIKELDYIDPERIFLQGESMGGLVTALVAAERPEDIRGMVLWYPAFVIPEDARKRQKMGDHTVFGIPLGETFDEEAAAIDVYGEIPGYGGPVLLLHGELDEIVPLGYSEKAAAVYPDAELIVMFGAGHGYDGADSIAARERSIAFIKGHTA